MKNKLFEFSQKIRRAKTTILKRVAVEALNHYKDKFTEGKGEWEGQKWQEPKRKTEGPKKYKTVDKNGRRLQKRSGYLKGFSPRDATRATLVGRGVLARSIRYRIEGSKIVFYSKIIYAGRHNEGERMPKRTFVGMEKPLKQKIEKILQESLKF
jgi:phage gpG-like protein